MNTNYSTDLLSTTFEEFYKTRPSDAIFGEFVLWQKLKQAEHVTKQGGTKILVPVQTARSTAVGAYSGYDTFDMTPQDGLTNAEFDWKQYYATVVIDNATVLINRGPKAVINILKARTEQAETSLAERFNTDAFLDGTGSGTETNKTLTGLALMVDATGTYGNIVRSTYAYWAAQETAVTGALAIHGSTGMTRMYNDCALGPTRQTPDLLITRQAIFEAYEALMAPYMRFTVESNNLARRKQNLMFRDAELYWDDLCQSQTMYFLNTKRIFLFEMESRGASVLEQEDDRDAGDFRVTPFVEPHNQDARSAKLLWMGNFGSDNPKRLGKLTGITNS